MACEGVQMWNLSGLVAAFLDLAVAYLLLCASALVYLASKFLGFFGLNLPCPCDGIFINIHNKPPCFNTLLIDFPTQKVSDVQLCVKQRFPFSYSEYPKEYGYTSSSIIGDNCVNGFLKIQGEAEASSTSVEGVSNHRPRSRLHRRRFVDLEYIDDTKPQQKKRVRQRAFTNVEMNESHDEDVNIKKIMQDNQQGFESFSGDDKNTIRLLEQKLKEEHIARTALYTELEKERSAAASAADEAMAMILRLQGEKASIEIEARQYQRILEEKSVYDAEEMSILKEILVRREMEKHFLEKEVEAYRQTVCAGYPNDEQYSFGKIRDHYENSEDVGLQEKEIIIANWNNKLTSKAPQETNKTDEKIIETCNGNKTDDQSLKDAFLESSSSCNPILDKDTHVHDLHIIGETEDALKKSMSETSPSAVHSEMVKIDSEIGRLRERLKLVQEGREKLGLSSENRERESVQLKLLEEIARQVQEIRLLTEPAAARQASLPPPTSKVLSKKRRSRSVCSGLSEM